MEAEKAERDLWVNKDKRRIQDSVDGKYFQILVMAIAQATLYHGVISEILTFYSVFHCSIDFAT